MVDKLTPLTCWHFARTPCKRSCSRQWRPGCSTSRVERVSLMAMVSLLQHACLSSCLLVVEDPYQSFHHQLGCGRVRRRQHLARDFGGRCSTADSLAFWMPTTDAALSKLGQQGVASCSGFTFERANAVELCHRSASTAASPVIVTEWQAAGNFGKALVRTGVRQADAAVLTLHISHCRSWS